MYFEDLPLSDNVLDALYDMHFEQCTPIQEQCIPHILALRDVIGIAQTGTGKTAAYLLPLLTLLETQPHPAEAVNCLIMAPTRELASQIDQALQGFAYYSSVSSLAIYGGNDGQRYEQERRSLRAGADIVVATPGRLLTHLDIGTLNLSQTTHLVLDEADRMLDMGFADDIMRIVQRTPQKGRQTILFSATLPPQIEHLARTIMHAPVSVKLAVAKPAENIQQLIYECREADKSRLLASHFRACAPHRVIVFASSKAKVKELHIQLRQQGLDAMAMHSDLSQPEREQTMQQFKAGHVAVLVATDIVSRGIDVDDIEQVINFDAPRDAEDYVHRIGRTARAGRSGSAITFVSERDLPALRAIERLLGEPIPRGSLPEGFESPDFKAQKRAASSRNPRKNTPPRRGRHAGQESGAAMAAKGGKSKAGKKRKPNFKNKRAKEEGGEAK
ncbi:MAG: DEAD/DEAH box helicase [Bacteroidaceae bacterium]|nr:DEAD/DEAH box helicase [Bacteroidaceae bacterium]